MCPELGRCFTAACCNSSQAQPAKLSTCAVTARAGAAPRAAGVCLSSGWARRGVGTVGSSHSWQLSQILGWVVAPWSTIAASTPPGNQGGSFVSDACGPSPRTGIHQAWRAWGDGREAQELSYFRTKQAVAKDWPIHHLLCPQSGYWGLSHTHSLGPLSKFRAALTSQENCGAGGEATAQGLTSTCQPQRNTPSRWAFCCSLKSLNLSEHIKRLTL